MSNAATPPNYHKLYPDYKYSPPEFHALNESVKRRVERLASKCLKGTWEEVSVDIRSFTITKDTVIFEVYDRDEDGHVQLDDEKQVLSTDRIFPYGITWLKANRT